MHGRPLTGNNAPPNSSTQISTPTSTTAVSQSAGGSTLQKNMSGSTKYAGYFWIALVVVFLIYDYIQTHGKAKEVIDGKNIRANFHNILVVTLAAVIGINGSYVLLAKLAAMKIPGLSKGAGYLLPLFSV